MSDNILTDEEIETLRTAILSDGDKFDYGKFRFSLIPLNELKSVIDVLEHGAEKYDVDNWQKVPNAETRYFDAAMRHIIAHRQGENTDPESGLPHLAHAICSLLFLMWFNNQEVNDAS